MFEHPRILMQTLDSLIEPFDEDPTSLKELIDTEIAAQKKRRK
jgi:hypothetical protein